MTMNFFISAYARDTARARRRRRTIIMGVTALFFLLFSGYLFYQARDWLNGPQVTVTVPVDGAVIHGIKVPVEGTVGRGFALTINGMQAYSDKTGRFSAELLLSSGVHQIEVVASDRFGTRQTVTRQIVVQKEGISTSE